jgi:hypothetical protein
VRISLPRSNDFTQRCFSRGQSPNQTELHFQGCFRIAGHPLRILILAYAVGFRYHKVWFFYLNRNVLSSAVVQALSEVVTWCAHKPFRSPELDPFALLDIPTWTHEKGSIDAWIVRKRDCYSRAIPWINETRSELLKAANIEIPNAADGLPKGRLLVYEPLETVDDGASEAGSMGFYDVHDAPPWDTWFLYADHEVLCWVPEFAVSRAQKGIDASPVDCIRWADWSRLAQIAK